VLAAAVKEALLRVLMEAEPTWKQTQHLRGPEPRGHRWISRTPVLVGYDGWALGAGARPLVMAKSR
jgi:hypothetical protein